MKADGQRERERENQVENAEEVCAFPGRLK